MIRLHRPALRLRCLLHGHAYTYRCDPPACARCGTTMRAHWLVGELPDWMRT